MTHSALEFLVPLLPVLLTAVFAYTAQPQDIDAANPANNTPFLFELEPTVAQSIKIHIINAVGNVFWAFESVNFSDCGPAAGETYSCHGLTLSLPTGSTTNAVDLSLATLVEWNGTDSLSGMSRFTLTISIGNTSVSRTYTIRVSQVVTPVDKADVYLMLDKSGSMSNMVVRMDLLKIAVIEFMARLTNPAFSERVNKFGVNFFDTALTENFFSTLVSLSPGAVENLGTNLINSVSASGGTALGTAINSGKDRLAASSQLRNLIVVTDGEQTIEPMVSRDGIRVGDLPINPDSSSEKPVRLSTIGMGSPSFTQLNTLQNLALANQGQCMFVSDWVETTTNSDGMPIGDIQTAFVQTFMNVLSKGGPQLVKSIAGTIRQGNLILADFPLNKNVDNLVIDLQVNMLSAPSIDPGAARWIQILKDDQDITSRARVQTLGYIAGKFFITQLSFSFDATLQSEGQWQIVPKPGAPPLGLVYRLTVLADDHYLDYTCRQSLSKPSVGSTQRFTATVNYRNQPVDNATTTAFVYKPGAEIGNLMARDPWKATLTDLSHDPATSSLVKYQALLPDAEIARSLTPVETVVPLVNQGNGVYEGDFSQFDVAGIYQVVFHIQCIDSPSGTVDRYDLKSMVVAPAQFLEEQTKLTAYATDGKLILDITPITITGTLISAAADAFEVEAGQATLLNVVDSQDGSYTLTLGTFVGDIDTKIVVRLFGQVIYSDERLRLIMHTS